MVNITTNGERTGLAEASKFAFKSGHALTSLNFDRIHNNINISIETYLYGAHNVRPTTRKVNICLDSDLGK